ncbi:hypothetical protein OQA88_12956 [Cercophora sp. LCS_1]
MATTKEETPPKQAFNFMALPREVQKDIISHCSQGDYICLSLVSKHFRELAAAHLYRNFNIVFPDEDDPAFDSPIDGLAGGLDTFVTSDYDYAKHLRDLSLDTLSAGDKAETAYKPYLYNVSCGKFMNTLLLLTLRKATSLESFRWNIRVELSRPVYQALHQIKTISNVHIRLQAGPSLYETPPPLPYNVAHHVTSAAAAAMIHMGAGTTSGSLQPPSFMVAPPTSLFYAPQSNAPPPPIPKPAVRAKPPKKTSAAKEPPTLSGFSKLKSLAVLDIDTLDVVTEIKTCVRNSSGTLQKLKLSFSDQLASQARKPPPDMDPEDSDPDDEFQVVPPPPPGPNYNDDVSGPARAFRAQEERKSQESVLGRIFDVEHYVVKKAPKKPREKEKEVKEEAANPNPAREFINAIKAVSAKLMKDVNGNGDFSASQQEILSTIEYAARKYVAAEESRAPRENTAQQSAGSSNSAPSSSHAAPAPKVVEPVVEPSETPSLFDQPAQAKAKDAQKDANPEDINIEEPEGELFTELQEGPAAELVGTEETPNVKSTAAVDSSLIAPGMSKAMATVAAQKVNFKILAEKLELFESRANTLFKDIQNLRTAGPNDVEAIAEAEKKMKSISHDIQDIQKEMDTVVAEIDDAEKQMPARPQAIESPEVQSQRISEYLRSTRGLALQSLCIYLIPVKPSVLSRAIDLRVLRRLTLLNVGPQAPIWAHLARENKESPLPLRKVFTDNVSSVFLSFISQLEELHEFFILERDAKYKPESFAPKTTTTIDQIRRLVLKKHMPTLKRLMIKNLADTAWDVNEKAVMLICKRGPALQELACNMGIRVIHTFMQNLAGLASLRALHIIQLRNDDTCVWVMRETKRFLIDNLSHHPHLKLEWISIDDEDRVERLLRPSELPKREKSKKSKGKQKVTALGGSDLYPALPSSDNWDVSSDSEEDEDLQLQQIETIDNIHFYDVWGVRIFKKEVVNGRLVRRVKCGEEKPACARCTSTGRTCDGYDRDRWPVRLRVAVDPLEGAELAQSEFLAACQHNEALRFMRPLAPDLDGAKRSRRFFSQARPLLTIAGSEYLCAFSAFWGDVSRLDLETLHPAVGSAIVALGATYQLVRFPDISLPDDLTPDALDVFAIQHYNQSIAHLSTPIDPLSPDSIRITLACCLIFIFIEALRQNHPASVTHLINGLRIISSLPASHLVQPPFPPPLSMASLIHLFSRLELSACFLPNSLSPTLIPRLSSSMNSSLPAQFTTPSTIHHHLTHFHYSVLAYINNPSSSQHTKLHILSSHLEFLTTTFLSAYPSLISPPSAPSGHRFHLDLLHFRCAQLLLHTHTDTNYATYKPLHLAILRLATILHPSPFSLGLGHRPLPPRQQKENRGMLKGLCPLVLAELHLAAPLWLVARQTGYDASLRSEVVWLMAETLVPVGQEGRIETIVQVLQGLLGGDEDGDEGPRGVVGIGCAGKVWDTLKDFEGL